MFSRPTKARSIASQLVLLFTPAAALLLFCGLGVLYWIVVRHAFAEDRAALMDRLFAIRSELKTPGGVALLNQQLGAVQTGGRSSYWVRVLDQNQQLVAQTPGMDQLLPFSVFPAALAGESHGSEPKDYQAHGKLFSLISAVSGANGHAYRIQVAQDRTVDEQFERQFGFLVAVVLGLGIIASALIAITVSRRGLRPLGTMTNSLMRMGPHRLNERVPPADWPRELQPVAIAFDDMLDRLEDSFTRLSQFSADLAHELRTPLANIRGEAEVALTRERAPNEYRAVIESNIAECARLSGIINNLLFLARAEAAESSVHPTLFEGRAALEKIISYNEAIAEEKHLTIRSRGEGQVFADPILFGRAVSNLVDNAVRFAPDGGEITLSISANADGTEISVTDNGCGIPREHLARVFDRFYRVDPSRSTEGTGLGLALVKSIAELHGGSVAITSERERGTTVRIHFPTSQGKNN